jgi:hypothetical protein
MLLLLCHPDTGSAARHWHWPQRRAEGHTLAEIEHHAQPGAERPRAGNNPIAAHHWLRQSQDFTGVARLVPHTDRA